MFFVGIVIIKIYLVYMRVNINKVFRSGVFVDDV